MPSTGTFQIYAKAIQHFLKADTDLDTMALKVMLVDSTYAPDMDADEFVSTVRAKERTGTNWAAGGQATTATLTLTPASNRVDVSLSDISVATVTLTDGKFAVVYNDSPATDAGKHLIGYIPFDIALAPTAGVLSIDFPTPTFSFNY